MTIYVVFNVENVGIVPSNLQVSEVMETRQYSVNNIIKICAPWRYLCEIAVPIWADRLFGHQTKGAQFFIRNRLKEVLTLSDMGRRPGNSLFPRLLYQHINNYCSPENLLPKTEIIFRCEFNFANTHPAYIKQIV